MPKLDIFYTNFILTLAFKSKTTSRLKTLVCNFLITNFDHYYLFIDNPDFIMHDALLSDFFNIIVIPNTIMVYTELGSLKIIVDGYYIFLKPLSPGKHVIQYSLDTENPTDEQ